MNTVELDVQGMSCGSCIAKVTDALKGLPGVDMPRPAAQRARVAVVAAADLLEH